MGGARVPRQVLILGSAVWALGNGQRLFISRFGASHGYTATKNRASARRLMDLLLDFY